MPTPVIFRRTKEGEIVAFFPTLPGDEDMPDNVCQGFTLKQGKVYVDIDRMRSTSEASYTEYLPLLEPMAEAGYADIDIVKRIQKNFEETRLNGGVQPVKESSVLYVAPKAKVAEKETKPLFGRHGSKRVA